MRNTGKIQSTRGGLISTVLAILMIFGYINNIVKLCKCDFEPSYGAEILHSVGVVTGLGIVFGYCDFGK